MKSKLFIFLILLFFTAHVFGQTKKAKEIETLAKQWVDANNAQDIDDISFLYASSLNFYAINKDKGTCIKEKKSFFEKYPKYSISISNLDIDFYKSGIVKCNFVKNEVWNGEPRSPLQGYLLFQKEGNSYNIIAESDQRMDSQRGYVPQLGNKVQKSSNITYMLIGAGTLLLILGVFYLVKNNKEQRKKIESIPMLFSQPPNVEVAVNLPEFTAEELKKNNGLAFEKYVVKNFDKNYFKLLNWRGDKYVDGHYPLSSMEPDLDYLYRDSGRQQLFAIECKWQQATNANAVKLADERKLNNYRNYQTTKNYPVFVILGIGGTGSEPNNLFIIPLNEISDPLTSKEKLAKYSRTQTGRFYLEIPTLTLK
ncbi:MAG: hypothetical protein SGI96_16370 [Bacteroidota bacterium]|nr:hypothetical protein [Bacteroidota bacterium]